MLFFDNREASPNLDEGSLVLRLSHQYSPLLKKKPLRFEDLAEFIQCYNPQNRNKRKSHLAPRQEPGRALAQLQLKTLSPVTKPAWTCSG